MTREQKKAQSRARHDRQVARRLEKKKGLQAEMESPEGDDEDLELLEDDDPEDITPDPNLEPVEDDSVFAETPHAVKKDYGGEMAMAPMGPTSWDELDFARVAQEQSHELRMASYDVEDLVRNILNHPVLEAGEKATAISAVGAGFKGRVDSILAGSDGEDMQKDLDLLTLEAMLATERRHTTVTDRLTDWVSKAALSYGAKQALSDDSYALVVTRGGVKVRKYVIKDKSHVRNALARAAQQIKAGGQGAADAKAALPKIHAAAKKMGIGMGKSGDANAILIEKDGAGDWRWVGWGSNNYIDWQGDIISKEAHEEYVGFLDTNPDMAPLFMTWHTPGTERKSAVDFWMLEKGFLILSGKLDEQEAAALLKAQALTDLGLSISGFGIRDAKDARVITKYRMVEVSDLPLENAANPFTDFSVIVKEVQMDKKEYLAALLGSPEKAEAFLTKTGMKQEALETAGVEQKDIEGAPKTEPKVEPPAVKPPVAPVIPATVSPEVAAVVKQVFAEMDIDGLNAFVKTAQEAVEKVPVLEELVKAQQAQIEQLNGDTDQKLAEKIAAPAGRFAWALKSRASESNSTKVDDEDPLVKNAPGIPGGWLSEVTHTKAIDASEVPQ